VGRGVEHAQSYKRGNVVVTAHGPLVCNSQAFPSSCKYCKASIYFFRCDHDSKVFFDDLGPPWPLHACYYGGSGGGTTNGGPQNDGPSYWRAIPGVSIIRDGRRRTGLLPGLESGGESMDPGFVRRAHDARNLNREIMRIEPLSSTTVDVVGVVQERAQPDLATRYKLQRESLGYSQLVKQIGQADPTQLTVYVDEFAIDPAAIDFLSYTFLCPEKPIGKDFRKGAVIQVRLESVEVIGVGRFWKAIDLERLF